MGVVYLVFMLGWKGRLGRKFAANIPVARKLREVVKLSLLEKESKDTIKDIWMKFHAPKEHLVARSMDKGQWESLKERLKACPMFIYPVKKDQGHYTLVGQAQENVIVMDKH